MRNQNTIIRDLCSFTPTISGPLDRLPHNRYKISMGFVKNQEHLQMLNQLVDHLRDQTRDIAQSSTFYEIMRSEKTEFIVQYIHLEEKPDELTEVRKQYIVYEDNFNCSLLDMVPPNSSFQEIRSICQYYEARPDVDITEVMKKHDERVAISASYFVNKGVPIEEAKALALALSFYTGTNSETCNQTANCIAHAANGEVIQSMSANELKTSAKIIYYLVKALSYIPYYWGYVTRACELTDTELEAYNPGCLITWIQFSSSKKGKDVHSDSFFQQRNTHFKIYSLTGRPIEQFSNFPLEEEVLFLPHSTFLVFNHETDPHNKHHTIYMRQVELGLCKWSILWVDDQIFDENWENKQHMESASAQSLNENVHFIPKSSTDSALSFLQSPFGQRLKNEVTFRIVTDMNRLNEEPTHNAGARLIKKVRQLGFNNQCLVFTSNKTKGEDILDSELNRNERKFIQVSIEGNDLRRFVNFE